MSGSFLENFAKYFIQKPSEIIIVPSNAYVHDVSNVLSKQSIKVPEILPIKIQFDFNSNQVGPLEQKIALSNLLVEKKVFSNLYSALAIVGSMLPAINELSINKVLPEEITSHIEIPEHIEVGIRKFVEVYQIWCDMNYEYFSELHFKNLLNHVKGKDVIFLCPISPIMHFLKPISKICKLRPFFDIKENLPYPKILRNFINLETKYYNNTQHECITFNHSCDEAKYIAKTVKEILIHQNTKVAICITSESFLESLVGHLGCEEISHNASGNTFNSSKLYTFLKKIIKLTTETTSTNLAELLKDHRLVCDDVYFFEMQYLRGYEFKKSIGRLLKKTHPPKVQDLLEKLHDLEKVKWGLFSDVLGTILDVACSIYPNFWIEAENENIADILRYLLKIKIKVYQNLEQVISLLADSLYYSKTNENARIVFVAPEQLPNLENYHSIFLTNFSEYKIIPKSDTVWLPPKIRDGITKILSTKDLDEISHYQLCLLLTRQNLYITRSKKTLDGNLKNAHSLIKLGIKDKIYNQVLGCVAKKKLFRSHPVEYQFLPKRISPSNFKILIDNPYEFYIAHVLLLKKLKPIAQEPGRMEFGTFIHYLLEHIEDYRAAMDNFFNENVIDGFIKRIWKVRATKMIENFLEVNNHLDFKREVYLSFFIKNIEIAAIIDRLEINDQYISIVDYKTGVIPSKKEVENFLSPQLLIEELICKKKYPNHKITNLSFIKLSLKDVKILSFPYDEERWKNTEDFLEKILERYWPSDLKSVVFENSNC